MSAKNQLLAIDLSGSTNKNAYYHAQLYHLICQFPNAKCLIWSDNAAYVSMEKLKQLNSDLRGAGETEPVQVAKQIVNANFAGDLILTTDGRIKPEQVEELDLFLKFNQLQLSHVHAYLIQTSKGKIDASVIAPFIRRFPHTITLFENQSPVPRVLASGGAAQASLFTLIRSVQSVTTFNYTFDQIFHQIVIYMMGRSMDFELRKELLLMQRRLLAEGMKPITRDNLNLDDICHIDTEAHSTPPQWPAKIFHLLRMSSGSLGGVFTTASIKSEFEYSRAVVAYQASCFEAVNAELEATDTFDWPIYSSDYKEVVIPIKKCQSPLIGLTQAQINSIIINPFNALEIPTFLQRFVDALEPAVDFQLIDRNAMVSPSSKEPILGGIFISPQKTKYQISNIALRTLVSGVNEYGDPNLWFIFLWYLVEIGRIPFLKEHLPMIRETVHDRIETQYAPLSLRINPEFTITTVRLKFAILNLLCRSGSLPNSHIALFRTSFIPFVTALYKCKISTILDEKQRSKLVRYTLTHTINENLKIGNSSLLSLCIQAAHNFLKINIHLLRPKLFRVNLDVLPLDGVPDPQISKHAFSKLPPIFQVPIADIRAAIFHALRGSLSMSVERFPDGPNIPNYNYGYEKHISPFTVEICPATCRPWHDIRLGSPIPWENQSRAVFKCNPKQQISLHKLYVQYVKQYHEFPDRENLLMYAYLYQYKKMYTLPAAAELFCSVVLGGYQQMIQENNLSIDDFMLRCKNSSSVAARKQIERSYYANTGRPLPPDPPEEQQQQQKPTN